MSHTQQHLLAYGLAAIGGIGILFNLVQIIIIINGNYNRNPDIQPPWLQTLDAIALTGLWLIASLVVLAGAFFWLRRQK